MSYRRRLLVLGMLDVVIVAAVVVLAFLSRFDFVIDPQNEHYFRNLPLIIAVFAVFTQLSFFASGLHRRVWQFASIGEMVAIIKATTRASAGAYLFCALMKLLSDTFTVPPVSVFLISWLFIMLAISGSRVAWRMFNDSYMTIQPHLNRTLIIGAGSAGALVVKELKHGHQAEMYPVGFIDDDKGKQRLRIMGLPVLGGRDKIAEIVEQQNIQHVIIAIPSADPKEISKIINICKDTKVSIKMLPRLTDLMRHGVKAEMIRDVRIEDLLGRDPIQVDLEGIANYVTDRVVLVTGAGGSIGSELCRQISPFKPSKLLLLGHGENSIYEIELELRNTFPQVPIETIIADIQDRPRMNEVFASHRPAVVFHAAAHKHVPLMERNPEEAVKNNILGTKNVAECAHQYGSSQFVMISSDKAVNPTSIMGTTKRVAEMIIQGLDRESSCKFVAVRFGNVLGSRGSVIPIFKKQIAAGGPVTVTHPEMIRYFMTIPEAVQLVIQTGALANGGEIFILDMGKPVKISDLARDLIRLSGFEPDVDIEIKYTGIRPGEKLFEELLLDEEGISGTKHDRIFVGQPIEFSTDDVDFMIRKLEQVVAKPAHAKTPEAVRELLKVLVPTFLTGTERNAAVMAELVRAGQEVAATKTNS